MLNGLGDISVAHYPVFSVENLSIVCNNKLNHMLPAGFSLSLSVYWVNHQPFLLHSKKLFETCTHFLLATKDCCCIWVRLAAWYFCGKRTGTIKRWIGCFLQWQICKKEAYRMWERQWVRQWSVCKKRCFNSTTLIFPKLQSFDVVLQVYTMWKRQCE